MENTQNLPNYIVYTDGGCAINPGGHGAYAAIIIHTDTGEIEEMVIKTLQITVWKLWL